LIPHEAPDLEVLLPATFCNEPLTKSSRNPESFGNLDPTLLDPTEAAAAIRANGKTEQDVSDAGGFLLGPWPDLVCEDTFFALRVAGADPALLKHIFATSATEQGRTTSNVSVSGKDATREIGSSGGARYLVYRGDTVVGVWGPSDSTAAAGFAALP
jgi:hypothetical protein